MFSPERMTGLLYMYDFTFDGRDASSLALFLCIEGFTLISVALRGVNHKLVHHAVGNMLLNLGQTSFLMALPACSNDPGLTPGTASLIAIVEICDLAKI